VEVHKKHRTVGRHQEVVWVLSDSDLFADYSEVLIHTWRSVCCVQQYQQWYKYHGVYYTVFILPSLHCRYDRLDSVVCASGGCCVTSRSASAASSNSVDAHLRLTHDASCCVLPPTLYLYAVVDYTLWVAIAMHTLMRATRAYHLYCNRWTADVKVVKKSDQFRFLCKGSITFTAARVPRIPCSIMIKHSYSRRNSLTAVFVHSGLSVLMISCIFTSCIFHAWWTVLHLPVPHSDVARFQPRRA